LSKLPAIMYMM